MKVVSEEGIVIPYVTRIGKVETNDSCFHVWMCDGSYCTIQGKDQADAQAKHDSLVRDVTECWEAIESTPEVRNGQPA